MVLLTFLGLSFVYRSYGALLALSWNACIWGVVLSLLVRRAFNTAQTEPVSFFLRASLAVLPHLVFEAAAYVLGSLAAIFVSKALFKYGTRHPLLKRILRSAAVLLALACTALVLAALFESVLPRLLL